MVFTYVGVKTSWCAAEVWLHLIKVAQHKAKGNICAKDAAAKEAYKYSSGTGWEIGIISLEFRSIPRPRVIVLFSLSRSSVRKWLKLILYRENHLPDHVFQSLKSNLVIVIVSDASEVLCSCSRWILQHTVQWFDKT